MKSAEEISRIQQELKSRGVKYCLGAYVDIHGIPKGKFVPIDHLAHMAAGSELYTGYALHGLGQAPNKDEIASVPDLDHIIQLPWQPEVAWMPADNTFHGEPYEINTRVALKKGSLVVNSSQGGGSKDTWIIEAQRSADQVDFPPAPPDTGPRFDFPTPTRPTGAELELR